MKLSVDATKVILCLALACFYQAATAKEPDPLFASDAILITRIVAPFRQLMTERPVSNDDQVSATFGFVNDDGLEVEFPVRILTRGNHRLKPDVCSFAPLRMNFKKGDLKHTLFHKQDKLKLVTHCNDKREAYRQAVIREYLAYRILNIVSDYSFRVRLLRMTYVFSDDDNNEEESYAILIESKKRLAKRLNVESLEQESVHLQQLDREHTNLVSVFQFLIGNVDFSPVLGRPGSSCCHNFALFGRNNENHWSIPYDFDLTGLVDPPHVILNPNYRQSSIRQRIYRGRCYNNDYIPASLQAFRDGRSEIDTLIATQAQLSNRHRKRVESYVESFYELLENEEQLIRKFEDACIG